MSLDQILAFALFAFVAAITPGPSNIILTAIGATAGVRRGVPFLAGVTIGMGIMMFAATYGLGSLIINHDLLMRIMKWGGVLILLWMSWKIATSGSSNETSDVEVVGFWRGVGLQWVNPKAWIVCVSAAGTFTSASTYRPLVQSLALGAIFMAISLPSCFIWLAFGGRVQRHLQTPRANHIFNWSMAGLLLCSILIYILE